MEEKTGQEFPPKPAAVVEWVDYQKESVVSRKLVQKPTGNVTFFAFDQGQELSEHTSPFDAIVQIIDGEAQISIAGNPANVHAGEIIVMPAHQPHALKAVKRFKMILTMIRS